MGPLEYIVDKISKHKQNFHIVIPKYKRIYIEGQFTLGKEVLKLGDLSRELGRLYNRSFRVNRFRKPYRDLSTVQFLLYYHYSAV